MVAFEALIRGRLGVFADGAITAVPPVRAGERVLASRARSTRRGTTHAKRSARAHVAIILGAVAEEVLGALCGSCPVRIYFRPSSDNTAIFRPLGRSVFPGQIAALTRQTVIAILSR